MPEGKGGRGVGPGGVGEGRVGEGGDDMMPGKQGQGQGGERVRYKQVKVG